jgi:serpin B
MGVIREWAGGLLRGGKGFRTEDVAPAPASPGARGAVREGNNEFALAMFGALGPGRANLVFSPFSIRTVLAMTQLGARGAACAQMAAALRTSPTGEPADLFLAAVAPAPRAAGQGERGMAAANSVWCQDGMPLLPEFVAGLNRLYAARLQMADFRRHPDAVEVAINRWVEEETWQRIRDLIPPGSLAPDSRLVLVNAVWFRRMWASQFRHSATREDRFYLEDGGTVAAPLMHRQGPASYTRGPDWQAVMLEYQASNLSMLVVLPDARDGLPGLEQRLSPDLLDALTAGMRPREVDVWLPRFTIEWGTADMKPPLQSLGMTIPFDPSRADFSGINGYAPPQDEALFISALLHKAVIDVNEDGTEAAAATASVLTLGCSQAAFEDEPVPVFRADHPFLFAIVHPRSGGIVFLGRVADPTKGR